MAYIGNVVRLPIGMRGFSGSRNPTQLEAEHLQFVEGVSLDGGLIQKEGGASKLNSSALGAPSIVRSGINWSPLANTYRDVVFLSSGAVLKDTGAGTFATTLRSGLADIAEPPPYFVPGGGESVGSTRKLFMFSMNNQVQVTLGDAATCADISTPPADWSGAGNFPTFGVMHEGRLWGGGNASDPHRIYYSQATNQQLFTGTGSGTLAVFPGAGERLVGGVSFKGALILFKYPKGVYIITTSDPSPTGWRVDMLTDAVGGVSPHTIVSIDNDVIYMDSGGNLHMLSATDAFGGIQTSNISQVSDLAEFMRQEIDLSKIRRACGVWYETKQQAWFAIQRNGGAVNDIRLVVDLSNPQTGVRFLLSRRDSPVSMWLRPDSLGTAKPVHGDNIGFVWLMDRDGRTKDGAGYPMAFETANTDLSFVDPKLATIDKMGDFIELVFEPQGEWFLTIQTIWDDVPGPPILFSMGTGSAPIGSFILDTDILSSTSIRSIRKRITGSGRRLRILVNNEGAGQTIAISDFYLSFRAANERNKR